MQKENSKISASKSSCELYHNKYKFEPHSPTGTRFKPERAHAESPVQFIAQINIQTYTPDFILSLKPQTNEIPKEYQLKSPGYVILKQFEESVDSNTGPIRKQRALRIHEGRFIPSIMRKKYVEGDEEEERKFAVQTCLNRLNYKNSTEIIKNLKELKASNDLIVNLLLVRAAADDDMPEKNSHLRNFANLAIQIANEDGDFKLICRKKSLDKYDELINKKSQELNINVIECLIVWISYLLIGGVIIRKNYFRCLELAIKRQPPDTAVGIIRASFFTCGKFLDAMNWSESSTFYYFMYHTRPSTGYLLFLMEDLRTIRESEWDHQIFNQNKNDNQSNQEGSKMNSNLSIKTTVEKDDQQLQKILRDKLLDDYTNWHEDPEFGTPRVPRQATLKEVVNAVIMNYANEQKKIQPQIEDYSNWFGLLIVHAEIDNKELPGFLKEAMKVKDKNSPEYEEFMIGFFTILGGLYDAEQINFSSITSLGVLLKSEYIEAVGKMTYIDQKEIYDALYPANSNNIPKVSNFTPVALSPVSSAPVSPSFLRSQSSSFGESQYDDSIIAALVTITYRSDNLDFTSEYGKAVDFSVIVYNCLEENEEATEPSDLFDARKNEIIEASKKMKLGLVTQVWNKIISSSQMGKEFIDKAKKYFHENILKPLTIH